MATSVTGKVTFLLVDRKGAFISVNNDPAIGPKDNAWRLKIDHSNYNALYSLALAAAANRWPLRIRIEGEDQIDPGREAAIRHMAVAWEAGVRDVD